MNTNSRSLVELQDTPVADRSASESVKNFVVLSALRNKRAELDNRLRELRQQAAQIEAEMEAIDTTILMFDTKNKFKS